MGPTFWPTLVAENLSLVVPAGVSESLSVLVRLIRLASHLGMIIPGMIKCLYTGCYVDSVSLESPTLGSGEGFSFAAWLFQHTLDY